MREIIKKSSLELKRPRTFGLRHGSIHKSSKQEKSQTLCLRKVRGISKSRKNVTIQARPKGKIILDKTIKSFKAIILTLIILPQFCCFRGHPRIVTKKQEFFDHQNPKTQRKKTWCLGVLVVKLDSGSFVLCHSQERNYPRQKELAFEGINGYFYRPQKNESSGKILVKRVLYFQNKSHRTL